MTARYITSVHNELKRIEENKWVLKISMVIPNIHLVVIDSLIEYIEELEKEIWRNKNE